MRFYAGTSGFNYKDWRGIFYPESLSQKKWLTYYAERFNTVEINATFYGSFERSVYQRWADQTGSGFIFSIKGPRFITHIKRLSEVEDSVERFFQSAYGLRGKLEVVLWQFPSNFKNTEQMSERLEKFLKILPSDVRQVIEFRDESWFSSSIYELFESYKISFVTSVTRDFSTIQLITGNLAYFRFHGPTTLYASLYSHSAMQRWAEKIRKISQDNKTFVYFNNDFHGFALRNADELRELIYSSSSAFA